MPFRLNYAPSLRPQLIELCLGDLNQEGLLLYLGEVINFSSIFKKHLQRVEQVSTRIDEHEMKLKAHK